MLILVPLCNTGHAAELSPTVLIFPALCGEGMMMKAGTRGSGTKVYGQDAKRIIGWEVMTTGDTASRNRKAGLVECM